MIRFGPRPAFPARVPPALGFDTRRFEGSGVLASRDAAARGASGADPAVQDHAVPIAQTDGTLRILLGDNHALVRHGIRRILEQHPGWAVVGEASNGRDAMSLSEALAPDVVILDVSMPLLNGVEAAARILARRPVVRILMLSVDVEESSVTQALKAGAHGYVLKGSADQELAAAVESVAAGTPYFSDVVARFMLEDYVRRLSCGPSDDAFDVLTARERETLQLVAEGYTNKAIADQLGVRPSTIETHRANAMRKLDLHSTTDIVLYAVRRGLVKSRHEADDPTFRA